MHWSDTLRSWLPAFGTAIPNIIISIAALTGELGQVPARSPLPVLTLTTPVFSVRTIATATPVLLILTTVQANLPSVVFLRDQEYHPPERVINSVSGVGTLVGSLLGPTAVSLSLPATALAAGEHQLRHRSVCLASGALMLVGVLASMAADLPEIIPLPLLLALAGLAVIGVLANALQQITRGPLLLGPLFAIALSKISILGFDPFFWALVIGTGISLLLERDELQTLRSPVSG
jgi:benzoate membrane transport protein